MATYEDTLAQIKEDVEQNHVVLFMKGDRDLPMCGFSARSVQILQAIDADFTTRNVLDDDALRQAIKDYSDWPTIPQLYVDGEFVGGSDIMMEMYQNGELKKTVTATP